MFKLRQMAIGAFLLLSVVGSVHAQNYDLTGVWHQAGGGTFFVRQIGAQVWWFGEQAPQNPRWANVANGTLNGDVLSVQWVDVPLGGSYHQGSLGLRVVASNHLVVISNPNDFVSADWYR